MKNTAHKKYLKILLKISLGIVAMLVIIYFILVAILIYNQQNIIKKEGLKSVPRVIITSLAYPPLMGYYILHIKIMEIKIIDSFKSIPGITIRSRYVDADNGFIYVTINVKNKGDIKFKIYLPEYSDNPRHLFISSIGHCKSPYYLEVISKGGSSPHLSVGIKIQSIKDVINNYDYILNMVKKISNSKKAFTDDTSYTARCAE